LSPRLAEATAAPAVAGVALLPGRSVALREGVHGIWPHLPEASMGEGPCDRPPGKGGALRLDAYVPPFQPQSARDRGRGRARRRQERKRDRWTRRRAAQEQEAALCDRRSRCRRELAAGMVHLARQRHLVECQGAGVLLAP